MKEEKFRVEEKERRGKAEYRISKFICQKFQIYGYLQFVYKTFKICLPG